MAKGKKTGGRDFQKGHSLGGRKALPPEIKEIANQTKPAIIEAYWNIINIHPDELRDFKPKTLLEAGMAKTIVEFVKTGKIDQIKHIWDQCHGRPVESHRYVDENEDDMTLKIEIEDVTNKDD